MCTIDGVALAGGGAAMGELVRDELVRYYVRRGQTAALEQLLRDGVIAANVAGYGKLIEACCLSTGPLDSACGATMSGCRRQQHPTCCRRLLRTLRFCERWSIVARRRISSAR